MKENYEQIWLEAKKGKLVESINIYYTLNVSIRLSSCVYRMCVCVCVCVDTAHQPPIIM